MKRIFFFLLGLFVSTWVHAVTVYYQPTPYPLKKCAGSPGCAGGAMPQDLSIIHVLDGWMNNYYPSIKTFQNTDPLKIGGYGDRYISVFKFDDTGLPSQVTNAYLYLYSLPRGTSLSSQVALYRATSFWDATVHWGDLNLTGVSELYYTTPPSTLPTLASLGYSYSPSPGINAWSGMWITDWYNGWRNGTYVNHGIVVYPNDGNNNQFDNFVSSNSTSDGLRPLIQLDFTPTLTLEMPVPGGARWLLTNEIGGYECMGESPWPDTAHQGSNYFSIDISPTNVKDAGGSYSGNIPIIAAAGGKIVFAGPNPSYPENGYYVVIDHDGDGVLSTGFQTRYLHMQPSLMVVTGQTVLQGDILGYMGGTGGFPVHLHFGVRYQDSGSSTVPQLSSVVMDGLILKSYQTECSMDGNGVPTGRIRYYHSSNTPY